MLHSSLLLAVDENIQLSRRLDMALREMRVSYVKIRWSYRETSL